MKDPADAVWKRAVDVDSAAYEHARAGPVLHNLITKATG